MTSRHDIFINAHKALRSELGRMVNLAGKLDFADADALAAFEQDFANLHRFLEVHG